MNFKKGVLLFLLIMVPFSLSSCYVAGGDYADFPRHRYKSIQAVEKHLPFKIIVPNFLNNPLSKENVKYFTTAIPGPVVTGYSVVVDNSGNDNNRNTVYNQIEFHGVNTNISGVPAEGFNNTDYTCIVNETEAVADKQPFFYAAYRNKIYGAEEIEKQKGIPMKESIPAIKATNIEYFYCDFEENSIRYSITFSEFRKGVGNDKVKSICIQVATDYIKQYK